MHLTNSNLIVNFTLVEVNITREPESCTVCSSLSITALLCPVYWVPTNTKKDLTLNEKIGMNKLSRILLIAIKMDTVRC